MPLVSQLLSSAENLWLSLSLSPGMHRVFQQDLARLRLQITRAYAKAITNRLTPLTSSPDCSLKIAAQVR